MILFSHPTGNANVRQAALALQDSGQLEEFWTCLNFPTNGVVNRLLPRNLAAQLVRRAFPPELQTRIHGHPIREAGRMMASRCGLVPLIRHETGCFSVDAVYRSLDRKASSRLRRKAFDGVYAYEDGAEFSFREASRRGIRKFYDLPIGYWKAARRILQEEAELEPEWAMTLTGNFDSPAKTDRKDVELAQADVIFAASSFTRDTLKDAPPFGGTVIVIPYGAPQPAIQPAPSPGPVRAGEKLRVLFVGSLGQRKGVSYLFSALRNAEKFASLTVIGTRPAAWCPALDRELARVRWVESCPHARILEEMAAHDVFVFPSLFEGFGLVLLEAMAMGLPVITTPHTAGPDLIEDGVQGFLVPIRSAEEITRRLEQLWRDPEMLREMSRNARLRAAEFTWEKYRKHLATAVAAGM